MNTQNFNQAIGFPFQTETLSEMQKAYKIFNLFGDLAGNFSIISGCIVTGSVVSNGAVFIDGEILEFRGGTLGTTVIIVQESLSQEFGDFITREVVFTRYVTFGVGINSIVWTNFKTIMPTTTILPALDLKEDKTTITALINRIVALENKPSNIPIGLIAIWGGLFDDIPDGWIEHVPLRGRMAVGQNPDDPDFATVGGFGGSKDVVLEVKNLPRFRLKIEKSLPQTIGDNDRGGSNSGFSMDSSEFYYTDYIGENVAHDNMSPYRIVHYIKYTG